MYEVYALKYAERIGRRAEHFLGGDPHDGPHPMDYFVWAIVGDGRCWVVDTGFGHAEAATRSIGMPGCRVKSCAMSSIGLPEAAWISRHRSSDTVLPYACAFM